jgi:hypothetical protein
VKTLEMRKKEISLELSEYIENQTMYEAIRDASERYKNGLGKIEEKDRITLIRKFIDKITIESDKVVLKGKVGRV